MQAIRSITLFSLYTFVAVIHASGQGYTPAVQAVNPMASPAATPEGVYQTPPRQQDPIRMQTLQTPPKSISQNGVMVYQNQTGQAAPQAGSQADRTMPTGFGSPYPTGTALVASAPNDPNRQPGAVYGLPPQGPQPQPGAAQPPVAGSAVPNNAVPGGATTGQPQRVHVGGDAPANRIVPFFLKPEEQQELDEFLVRWEKYSETIRRFDVDFTSYIYDPTIPRANPEDVGKPTKTTFGFFKYIAPSRFVFHVEGEWVNGAKVKRNEKDEKTFSIVEEKIIIDDKSVYYYDFNAKTVRQINIPKELIGRGIADSPLPLIFGAKAEDMKKRFFMKIVTREDKRGTEIWLQARPRLIEDQQEFLQIEIRLDRKTLRAAAIKKDETNGKAYTVYVLNDPKINNQVDRILEDLKAWFVPTVERGWKHTVEDMGAMQVDLTPQTQPGANPATPQGMIANPANPQPQRNEIQLYSPR